MAYLIDTSVFVETERRRISIPDLLDRLPEGEAALAAVTASELFIGVHRADAEVRRLERTAYVEQIVRDVPVIAFDLEIARTHARVAVEMRAAGIQIGTHDLQIAATALFLGYDVLTINLRDFQRVPGLRLQSFADLA